MVNKLIGNTRKIIYNDIYNTMKEIVREMFKSDIDLCKYNYSVNYIYYRKTLRIYIRGKLIIIL